MHVSLLIDLLTLTLLIRNLFIARTRSQKLLSLACVIYLLYIAQHYFFVFAPFYGYFGYVRHRSMTAIGIAAIMDFFGGFWAFFGVMVLLKGVTYIALACMIHHVYGWISRTARRPPQTAPIPIAAEPP